MIAQMFLDMKLNCGFLLSPPPPNTSLHEPSRSGRHPACRRGLASCRPDLLPSIPACGLFRRLLRRAGSPVSTAGRMPSATVQGSNARKWISENFHLDPLSSSDEGRGNAEPSNQRTPASFCECGAPSPLPFGREDQGEGSLRKLNSGSLFASRDPFARPNGFSHSTLSRHLPANFCSHNRHA